MATQAIRFTAPPGQTITLDVFTLSSDTAEQSALVCTEETNRKGLYVTDNFTDTLAGRHYIVKKISGTAIGTDFVTMLNANGTYDAEGITVPSDAEISEILAQLDVIQAKTDLVGTGYAVVNSPVSADGDLVELIKDTDYLAANGRDLIWAFDEITGITTSATGRFGIQNVDDGAEVYVNTAGVVTEPSAGEFQVSFDIPNTALATLPPGNYNWSVEVTEGSVKITIARNRQVRTQVEVVEKYTYY